MATTPTHDLREEMDELRSQLAHLNRIGFLFGAGISKALGIPDMGELTEKVLGKLKGDRKKQAQSIRAELSNANIEQVLTHIRLIRQITKGKKEKNYDGINGEDARSLDIDICNAIYEVILAAEQNANLGTAKLFTAWLNWLRGDYTKEIFTANYDLIMEKALEDFRFLITMVLSVRTSRSLRRKPSVRLRHRILRLDHGFGSGNCTDRSVGSGNESPRRVATVS